MMLIVICIQSMVRVHMFIGLLCQVQYMQHKIHSLNENESRREVDTAQLRCVGLTAN